jgi:hypothetical protein
MRRTNLFLKIEVEHNDDEDARNSAGRSAARYKRCTACVTPSFRRQRPPTNKPRQTESVARS